MASLKVFVDTYSQPCRAVLLLLEVNKVPYETQTIKIAQGEHKSDEYKQISPLRKVPAIDDGGFKVAESATIMRYIVDKYRLPDHWYPADPQRRAKINEYLDWHHQYLRVGAAHTLFQKLDSNDISLQYVGPRMLGLEPNEEKVAETTAVLHKSERLLESYFLKSTKFINSDEISIADLQAVCEFTQYWSIGQDPFQGKPRLAQWMEDCKKELQPHLDKTHKIVYLIRDKGIFKANL